MTNSSGATGLSLGELSYNDGRISFAASRPDGDPLIVELDSGAMMRLADGAFGDALIASIELKRGKIRAAADRLFQQGFWYVDGTVARLTISVLDLE